ncbi:MAG: hypothetical protein AAGF85_00505 [Bacteroidota bacterium]
MKLGEKYILVDGVTAEHCGVDPERFRLHIRDQQVRPLATSGHNRVVCTDAAGKIFYIEKKLLTQY